MPFKSDREQLGWREYRELLGALSKWFLRITVFCALVASGIYWFKATAIEDVTNRSIMPLCVSLLLILPILIQGGVFYFLHKRFQQTAHDGILRTYFTFYFSRMAFSLFSYTILWLTYVIVFNWADTPVVLLGTAFLPVVFIIILVVIVIHATYLITKSSFRTDKLKLTTSEIATKYTEICTLLKTDLTREVEKIREGLRKDRDCKVSRAIAKREVEDLDVDHLTEALNRLITNRDFYGFTSSHQKLEIVETPLPRDIESSNRRYLDTVLLQATPPIGPEHRKQPSKRELRLEERLMRQKGQRDGIELFPFYTMVFFFSIFLCVAYVFGFAFAFADRYVRSTVQKHGALFMADDLLEDVNQTNPQPSPTRVHYKLDDVQTVFYFTSGGGGIAVKKIENAATYANQPATQSIGRDGASRSDKNRYISEINEYSLRSLVMKLKSALEANKMVRIELVGRADDNKLNTKGTYSSNYEVARVRLNNVRYALEEKLIELKVAPGRIAAVEWIELPFSNDETLRPKRRPPEPEDRIGGDEVKKTLENSNAFWVLSDSAEAASRLELVEAQELLETIKSRQKDKHSDALRSEIRMLWERLTMCIAARNLTKKQGQRVIDDIDDWETMISQQKFKEAKDLRNQIEQELYNLEDPEGSQRAVEASFFEASPLSLTTNGPQSKRMALMDYQYFAMSTITTTGYGDIRPLTPYAKFLCTLASVTEFFFIVVFFNTLLSLRRKNAQAS